jgi:hypothetical protein
MDDKNVRRRFRASNYQVGNLRLTIVEHDQSQTIHLYYAHEIRWGLESDPVQLVRLYKKSVRNKLHWDAEVKFLYEFVRVQIHANCRIRRIYFSDRLYTEDELPPEFKLFLPIAADRNTAGAGAVGPNPQLK